jgi:hypothetical protein
VTTLLLAPSISPADLDATATGRVGWPGPTLDEVIAAAWEGLDAGQAVSCPTCGETMLPTSAGPGEGALGRCAGCGSELC